jgi:hypothetical protein
MLSIVNVTHNIDNFLTIPDFIWNGIIKLLITTISGLIISYYTYTFLKKKNERTRVAGIILERRLLIYQDFLKVVNKLGCKKLMPGEAGYSILDIIEKTGFTNPNNTLVEYSQIFDNRHTYAEFFHSFEQTFFESKLYLDDNSVKQLYYMQSWFALVNSLLISIEQQLRNLSVEIQSRQKYVLDKMTLTIGTIMDDEISEMCFTLEQIFTDNVRDLKLTRRKRSFLNKDFFIAEDGYIMKRMKSSVLSKKENILKMQTVFLYLALGSDEDIH